MISLGGHPALNFRTQIFDEVETIKERRQSREGEQRICNDDQDVWILESRVFNWQWGGWEKFSGKGERWRGKEFGIADAKSKKREKLTKMKNILSVCFLHKGNQWHILFRHFMLPFDDTHTIPVIKFVDSLLCWHTKIWKYKLSLRATCVSSVIKILPSLHCEI